MSSLTAALKALLEHQFSGIAVLGEISNFKQHSSGHRYFTLKDAKASLQCVMWRSTPLRFQPTDGMKVVATGDITVYPPRGNYQLTVRSMKEHSAGDLLKALEELKKKLESKGYFDAARKRQLPAFPRRIGVATSGTGAAVRDIVSTLERRWPMAEVLVRPTIVQGDEAAPDIRSAIQQLDSLHCDVLIVGRGGGSIEDLWAFNEEMVCDAIYSSHTPVVSAVGHETDITLADFVADVRAATPTAAAELVSPNQIDVRGWLTQTENKVAHQVHRSVNEAQMRLDDIIGARGLGTLHSLISDFSNSIAVAGKRMSRSVHTVIKDEQRHLSTLHRTMAISDPERPLQRGYALLKHKNNVLSSTAILHQGDHIEIVTAKQYVEAIISSTEEKVREKDI